jgi:hypothetical protein
MSRERIRPNNIAAIKSPLTVFGLTRLDCVLGSAVVERRALPA